METKLNFRPVSIEDKARVERYTRAWKLKSSGYNFTTMLIWSATEHIRIAEQEDILYVLMDYGTPTMCAPLPLRAEDYPKALATAHGYCECHGVHCPVFGITEELKPYFPESVYDLTEDRANFDYVYDAEALRTLTGKKLHAKRNHINRYLATHEYTYTPITPAEQAECMEVYDAWQTDKGESDPLNERRAIATIFANMEALGVVGGGIREQGRLRAFSLGERMDENTALIHIEKAEDEPGLFALINREFLRAAFPDVTLVNREEDMDMEGLRRAKLSYDPLMLIPKYVARRK